MPASAPGELLIEDRIAWLRLDDRERQVNTLSRRLLSWLEPQLSQLERLPLDGLVVVSGKPDSFVAGADLEELAALGAQPVEVLALVERGHQALGRLAALPFPTVAAIHGICLGGGLELALACRRRVATDAAATRIGLPEVQLGLIPGLGGTQRLPRLLGVTAALDLILSGRRIDAHQAQRLGLVDDVCSVTVLAAAAVRQLELAAAVATATAGTTNGGGEAGAAGIGGGEAGLVGRRRRPRRPLAARVADRLARLPLVDALVWRRARRQAGERAGKHYPAPRVALEIVRRGLRLPLDRALALEAGAFVELAASAQARNLVGLAIARRQAEARAAELARGARPVRNVAVIGAGLMGAGIAQVLAERGVQVVLKDRDQGALGRAMAVIAAQLRRRPAARHTGEADDNTVLARIRPTLRADALRHVELVIEAVFEDLALKQSVLREVESQARQEIVFASNTSSIPIARIAEASAGAPVVGMHFFSPVPRMPLLEVIRHRGSPEAAVATAVAVGRRMRKTVIVVEDGPGFFTTRVLAPLLNEAAWLLAEGARIDQVDAAMVRWGWPLGPFALLDEVGIDVGAHVVALLHRSFGERLRPPPALARLVAAGFLGRKAGRGFYRAATRSGVSGGAGPAGATGVAAASAGRAPGTAEGRRAATGRQPARRVDERVYSLLQWREGEVARGEIAERCWLPMLAETVRCLEEGIVASAAEADLAVVLGLGFPAFRGGVLRQADSDGLATVVARLEAWAGLHGERFAVPALLRRMASEDETFYPAAPGRPG